MGFKSVRVLTVAVYKHLAGTFFALDVFVQSSCELITLYTAVGR